MYTYIYMHPNNRSWTRTALLLRITGSVGVEPVCVCVHTHTHTHASAALDLGWCRREGRHTTG